MNKDFVIDQVSWHTQTKGNPESPERVKERFLVLVAFLQSNALTVRELLHHGQQPSDDFCIRKSDLTEEGFEVIKKAYDKWLKRIVNRNKDLNDLGMFQTALAEVRQSAK